MVCRVLVAGSAWWRRRVVAMVCLPLHCWVGVLASALLGHWHGARAFCWLTPAFPTCSGAAATAVGLLADVNLLWEYENREALAQQAQQQEEGQ